MGKKRSRGRFLDLGQPATETKIERLAGHSLVDDLERDTVTTEQFLEICLAAPRDGHDEFAAMLLVHVRSPILPVFGQGETNRACREPG